MAAAAGSAGIITVPNTTTSATVVTSSRLRAFTTPSTAAAAAAPQIEKLHAISSRCVQPSPSTFPSAIDPAIPPPTTATTTASVPHPNASTFASSSCRPSSATPMRSSRRDATATPGSNTAPGGARFATTAPSRIAISSGLIPPSRRAATSAAAAATAHSTNPGNGARTRSSTPGRVCAPTAVSWSGSVRSDSATVVVPSTLHTLFLRHHGRDTRPGRYFRRGVDPSPGRSPRSVPFRCITATSR